jgi:hypothetical protein
MRTAIRRLGLAVVALGLVAGHVNADVVPVSGFDSSFTSPGVWFTYDMQTGGTASVVAAPGTPPFSPGAALLTTTASDNSSKAQIGVIDNFGAASNLGANFTAAYDFYKETYGPTPNASAAPALKLTVSDGANAITFVYEPYYNGIDPVPTGQWIHEAIDATHGEFWTTNPVGNGFGLTNQGGGSYATNQTLAEWVAQVQGSAFKDQFNSAGLALVGFGMGTYNLGQMGYVDSLTVGGTPVGDGLRTYDFQPVPEPSTLTLAGLGALGLLGYRWNRRGSAR